ncbi:zinc transporter ZntB [Kangiella koreensis]|uniref:Mg2 transporter protein CorA family protein n=1 Tax=Kangiella koreensis (strain DSM 16069 / JCM 12317 / KCTC 12182 / SW-125) TaxID=523791 RepID=C7RBI8_KANKD|nr:zinc transporter ZntB [Kangiella koreensis]ACV26630.1 Mg2 transporter protein CorA family protein [Kangiella koreensis DSM 16069]
MTETVHAPITSLHLTRKGGLLKNVSLDEEQSGQPLIWHHINYTSPIAKDWLDQEPRVNEVAQDILLRAETRPRFYMEDNTILMCLRGVNLNPDAQPEDMISIRLWVTEDMIITSCNRHSWSITDITKALEQGTGPKTSGEFMSLLIERLAIRVEEFFEELDISLDQQEDTLAGVGFDEFYAQISHLRRQSATIKRYLTPQKDALEKLYRSQSPIITKLDLDNIRDDLDKFTRLLEDIELTRERTIVLQEEYLARIAHQQNSRLYVLAIISAIFLPLTFLTGVFGMNVAGLPGLEHENAFLYVASFCFGLAVALLIWFKFKKWY